MPCRIRRGNYITKEEDAYETGGKQGEKPFISKSIHACKVNVVFSDVPSNNLKEIIMGILSAVQEDKLQCVLHQYE